MERWTGPKPTCSIPSTCDIFRSKALLHIPEKSKGPKQSASVQKQIDLRNQGSFPSTEQDLGVPFLVCENAREGVQFKFECVSGLCSATNSCFLADADDIGSGNSLQSIHQLFTLLRQVIDGNPKVRKAVIATPINVSSNWEAEIMKWVGSVGKRVRFVTLCESTGDDVLSSLNCFASPGSHLQVLIVSYKTYQMHLSKFGGSGSCDLLICDEAHMLKSDQTTNQTPNTCGREPSATEDEKLGIERSAELSVKDNQVNVVKDGKLAQQLCARKQAVPSVSMRAV